MNCPICGDRLLPGADRCPGCGYRIVNTASHPGSVPESPPPRKRRGCCCLFPAILLLLTLLPGLFHLVRNLAVNVYTDIILPAPEPIITTPYDEAETVPLPEVELIPDTESLTPTAEGCFAIDNGAVTFLPELWDGGPVLQIPGTVNGQTVTALSTGCFRNCTELTTILLPESLTEIRAEAFAGCKNLRGLYLPDGMASIGTDAFAGCIRLEAMCIPATVVSIAPGAFDDCASMRFLIYDGTFEQWNGLYSDYITPFTTAICLNGSFYHGAVG